MRPLRVAVGTVAVWLLFLVSTAYPWGLAAHAYLAHWLNKPEGDRDLNAIYGAMAPDMFNFRFDLPVYGEGEIYFQFHYLWQNVWGQRKTGMEKGLGYGFISHTVAHNTVMVNAAGQRWNASARGRLHAFAPDEFAQLVEASAEGCYPNTVDLYRRTLMLVEV